MPEYQDAREGVPHGNNRYIMHKCRCDICRADHAWYQAEGVIKRRDRLHELPPEAHGRLGTYTNWGCRCDLCKAAASVDSHDRYVRKQLAHEKSLTEALLADQGQTEKVCDLGFTHIVGT